MNNLNLLCEVSVLWERLRACVRIGKLSREPLEILRLELAHNTRRASCDWLIRPHDAWDEDVSADVRERLQSRQALCDGLAMRKHIFRLFPAMRTTELRAFRPRPNGEYELVLAGIVERTDEVPRSVRSIAMRAHLCGFHFRLSDGVLRAIPCDSFHAVGGL